MKAPKPHSIVRLQCAAALFALASLAACGDDNQEKGRNPETPLPGGSTVNIGDWSVTFPAAQLDYTEDLLQFDSDYAGPEPGYKTAVFGLEATYNGSEATALVTDLDFGMWVDGETYNDCTGDPPLSIWLAPEVPNGETTSGTVCAEIPVDAENPLISVSGEGADPYYIEMPEGADDEQSSPSTVPGSTPDDPLPPGSAVDVSDWTVSVQDVKLDATEEILAESDGYPPVDEGFQLAMITVEGTYNGSEIGVLDDEVIVGIWADGAYYDACPYFVPNELAYEPEVSPGGTVTGNVCAEIPTGSTEMLVYFTDFDTEDQRYHIEIG
jgi:hypothetical protein